MGDTIRIGTRGSKLALWQANWVKSALLSNTPDLNVEIVVIKTKGDKILDVPLAKVGGKGLFVKEIEESLLAGDTDIAIHSMKDMPAVIPDGLCIGAVPERETPYDALISNNRVKLADLPEGAKVGTSSLRRASQLMAARPDLSIVPLRGNIDTRLRKLSEGQMDAIILAAAGIKRLGFEDAVTECIPAETMLPAVGQGALCIEIRENDPRLEALVHPLNHHDTRVVVMGERAFLNRLEGSCQIPVAAHGKTENGVFTLHGLVAEIDGSVRITDTHSGPEASSETIGVELANRLLEKGAKEILEKLTADGE